MIVFGRCGLLGSSCRGCLLSSCHCLPFFGRIVAFHSVGVAFVAWVQEIAVDPVSTSPFVVVQSPDSSVAAAVGDSWRPIVGLLLPGH